MIFESYPRVQNAVNIVTRADLTQLQNNMSLINKSL